MSRKPTIEDARAQAKDLGPISYEIGHDLDPLSVGLCLSALEKLCEDDRYIRISIAGTEVVVDIGREGQNGALRSSGRSLTAAIGSLLAHVAHNGLDGDEEAS